MEDHVDSLGFSIFNLFPPECPTFARVSYFTVKLEEI